MREQIRQVMRFSGPRMLCCHPVMATRHVIETQREKRKLRDNMKFKKVLWTALGCVGLGLGAVGVVVPFCRRFLFAVGTGWLCQKLEKLHRWF